MHFLKRAFLLQSKGRCAKKCKKVYITVSLFSFSSSFLFQSHNDFPWNLRKFLQNQLRDLHFDTDLRKVCEKTTFFYLSFNHVLLVSYVCSAYMSFCTYVCVHNPRILYQYLSAGQAGKTMSGYKVYLLHVHVSQPLLYFRISFVNFFTFYPLAFSPILILLCLVFLSEKRNVDDLHFFFAMLLQRQLNLGKWFGILDVTFTIYFARKKEGSGLLWKDGTI